MQLPKKCLNCGTALNLNTSFELTLMGHTYKVWLCDEHSNTTPKDAKASLTQKLTELDEVLEKVKSMGMVAISQEEYDSLKSKKGANKLVSTLPKELSNRLRSNGEANEIDSIKIDPNAPTGVADFAPSVRSVLPKDSAGLPGMANYASHKVKREKDLQVVEEKVKTETGREVVVPKLMKSKDGTTVIKIAQTFTGDDLTKRMKAIDKASRDNDNEFLNRVNYDNKSYGEDCRKCKGIGTIINKGATVICASCGGSGLMSS